MRPLTSKLGHVIERYVESDTWAQMVKKRQFLTFLPVRSSRTDHRHPDLVVYLDIGKCTKKKFHISINNFAQGCSKLISNRSRSFGPFCPWFFTLRLIYSQQCQILGVTECRWLASYKQTKNQINATTHITAGSCYREVRWKWHVGTNGQKGDNLSPFCPFEAQELTIATLILLFGWT